MVGNAFEAMERSGSKTSTNAPGSHSGHNTELRKATEKGMEERRKARKEKHKKHAPKPHAVQIKRPKLDTSSLVLLPVARVVLTDEVRRTGSGWKSKAQWRYHKRISILPALFHSLPHPLDILPAVVLVQIRCFHIRRRGGVGVIEKTRRNHHPMSALHILISSSPISQRSLRTRTSECLSG